MNLTDEEVIELVETAAKKAVTELRKREKKERENSNYHNTETLMRHYRDAVFHKKNAISEGVQAKIQGMNGREKGVYLQSIRETKIKTMLMLDHVDKAIEEIEKRRDREGREIEYRAFEMYYMKGLDYQQIAEGLGIGANTPRRWIEKIIEELSFLLWGIGDMTGV